MGRKKYFAALAAAGMIGAMAVDQCSIHTPQMAGPSQMTTGPTLSGQDIYRLAGNQRGKILYGPFRWTYDYRI